MAYFCLLAFVTSALAATPLGLNLTSSGCVDASGFQSCQNAANIVVNKCFASTGGDGEATEACACEDYVLNYNCYATHCWNQIWGCEYQEYIMEYLLDCPTAKLPVPYFPAPKEAAGACSCSLGDIYLAVTDSVSQGASCMQNATSSNPFGDKLGACGCCEISGAMSSLYEICPDVQPELIGLSTISRIETLLDIPFSECQPMTQINCATDLSFSVPGVTTYYPPSGLPASGTASLTNEPGTVTAPPSGSIFSYTNGADKVVYTITAAKASGDSNGSPGSGSSASGSSGSGSSGSGSSGSGKSSAAKVTSEWTMSVLLLISLSIGMTAVWL